MGILVRLRSDKPSEQPAPENPDAVAYLEWRIAQAIGYTRRRRRRHQRWATLIRIMSVLLSASATIILGLQDLDTATGLAFSFIAVVTLVNALEPFFNFRGIWVLLEEAQARHHRLQDDLKFYLAETRESGPDPAKLREFHEEEQRIWRDMERAWIDLRRAAGPQT